MTDSQAKPQIFKTAKGDVECLVTGGDGPAILALHGGMGGWDQAIMMMSWMDLDSYKFICPSRPGYLGTPIESGPSFEDQADLLAAMLDTLGIDKVAAVGVSAGGPPAYTFAIRHPDRVWGLVTIDAVSGYYDIPETAGAITKAIFLSDFGQKILKKVEEKRPDMYLKQLYQAEGYYTKEQMQKLIDHVLNTPSKMKFAVGFMETMFPWKDREVGTYNDIEYTKKLTHIEVEKITCPSLIVHGTHDADVKFYDGVYAYEHIPGAERYWMEQGFHLGFWLNPGAEEAQAAVLSFLKRHQP